MYFGYITIICNVQRIKYLFRLIVCKRTNTTKGTIDIYNKPFSFIRQEPNLTLPNASKLILIHQRIRRITPLGESGSGALIFPSSFYFLSFSFHRKRLAAILERSRRHRRACGSSTAGGGACEDPPQPQGTGEGAAGMGHGWRSHH
jgi:hypothetical protein